MSEFLEPFERMLTALFPPERVRGIDAGAEWASEQAEIERSGFLDALVPEGSGGAGLSIAGSIGGPMKFLNLKDRAFLMRLCPRRSAARDCR